MLMRRFKNVLGDIISVLWKGSLDTIVFPLGGPMSSHI